MTNDDASDPARTLTDLTSGEKTKAVSENSELPPSKEEHRHHLPAESTIGIEREKLGLDVKEKEPNILASLPSSRKTILLLCFCTAMFM